MAGWIWGQTRDLDDRTFGPVDLTKPRPDARCYQGTRIWGQARYHGDRHNAGYTRYGDRHDVRYTDQERSTSNVQLSTFNGVTERKHGGLDMGTDTVFGPPAEQIEGQARYLARAAGFLTHRNWPSGRSAGPIGLRRQDMGTDTMSGVPIGNVQRQTPNSQPSTG